MPENSCAITKNGGKSRLLFRRFDFFTGCGAAYSSMEIAFSGHSSTQVPQSTQVSASMFAFSFILIASTGHTSAQLPQPVHFSISTFAAISNILSIITLMYEPLRSTESLANVLPDPGPGVFFKLYMHYFPETCNCCCTADTGNFWTGGFERNPGVIF